MSKEYKSYETKDLSRFAVSAGRKWTINVENMGAGATVAMTVYEAVCDSRRPSKKELDSMYESGVLVFKGTGSYFDFEVRVPSRVTVKCPDTGKVLTSYQPNVGHPKALGDIYRISAVDDLIACGATLVES